MSLKRPMYHTLALALAIAPFGVAGASPTLGGSESSMVHQHAVAVEERYSFLRSPADVQRLVAEGLLVPVTDGADYSLSGVSFPYTRPEVRSFIEHFAAEYRAGTGHALVVTSLTRPEALQPRNAHVLSVHPAGMAVDFRVPASASDRTFLERALLAMESAAVLDATREHTPPHYHVAVFPDAFHAYAATLDSATARARLTLAARTTKPTRTVSASGARGEAGGVSLPLVLAGVLLLQVATGALLMSARGSTV
ncbi:MAG: hypothetical protein JWN53_643 [Gemmatimonadetes bacterium]|nr:hypothetical protein [Gemmatimonadota bacterium]